MITNNDYNIKSDHNVCSLWSTLVHQTSDRLDIWSVTAKYLSTNLLEVLHISINDSVLSCITYSIKSKSNECRTVLTWSYSLSPFYRQISIISADGEGTRSRSVRRHGCSQRKHGEPQEKKKPHEMEKLIQAETAETGRVRLSELIYKVLTYFIFRNTICLFFTLWPPLF